MHILKKFMIFSLFFIIPLFVSGYGYTGELPVLGGKSKIEKQPEIQVENEIPEIKPDSIIIPRPSVGHKTNKYSTYLADIREIENLLKEIKTILQNHDRDKIQLFCAKVNLLNLYTDTLEKKYGARPEKYYESYRQLLILDNYLAEIVDYRKGLEKYRSINEKTLENRVNEEKYLKQKIDKAIMPINTVIGIIEETG